MQAIHTHLPPSWSQNTGGGVGLWVVGVRGSCGTPPKQMGWRGERA